VRQATQDDASASRRFGRAAPQTLLDAAEVAVVVIQRGPPNGDASDRLPGAWT
jgi:hypothetical protein